MQHLEVSLAVQHIYIYMSLGAKGLIECGNGRIQACKQLHTVHKHKICVTSFCSIFDQCLDNFNCSIPRPYVML